MLARPRGHTLVGADPVLVVRDEAVWAALRHPSRAPSDALSAMAGGWVALLSYEFAGTLERLPEPVPYPAGPPRALAARYPTVAVIDARGRGAVVSVDDERAAARLADLAAPAGGVRRSASPPLTGRAPDPCPVSSSLPGAAYPAAVERAREWIRAGDCYQVNLAQRLAVPWNRHPVELARALWSASGEPAHRAYLALEEGTVVSASPELLLRVADGVAETAPIKGTAPAGSWESLAHSAKDRAEHVMIVDLMRNDLARCAAPDGVRVDELFAHLSTPYVEHMVSRVSARLADDAGPMDALRAVFPGGSVTGCPKIRSMEAIRELEPVARGPAFGSVLTLGADGHLEASVAIRTAWVTDAEAHYWCGGAVTWDSDPRREHAEAWAKAAPFLAATGAREPAR